MRTGLMICAVALSMAGCEKGPPSMVDNKPTARASAPPSSTPEKLWAQAGSSAALPIPAPPDVAAPPPDAVRLPSGLVTKVLQPGTGTEHPWAKNRVLVHYTGWTPDGKMFDNTRSLERPMTIGVDTVSPGWTEGLQLMVVGEKRRFWIPEELARRTKAGAPSGMLVFDFELFEIRGPKAIPPPSDVAQPPADAIKTSSGLVSKVLEKGKGTVHPTETSKVQVHYSGWTTDGKLFDSSMARQIPATFPLNGVIAGWTEGLQLMVEGEKRRFWIPQELAYKGRSGSPAGTLVFDVELLSIVPPAAPAPSTSFSPAAGKPVPGSAAPVASIAAAPSASAAHP